ncbi:hypothetical protein HA402_009118 [Bradysia odoriphaga]|nr:hypothetical protein HA402_009118 [Bradysia odoriphaga]
MSHARKMLKIVPPDAITFNYIGNELVGTLILENIIQEHVAFKIKATSEPKFTIRPDTGVLSSGTNAFVNIVMLQGQEIDNSISDNFIILSMKLSSDNCNDPTVDLWSSTDINQVNLYQLKSFVIESIPKDSLARGMQSNQSPFSASNEKCVEARKLCKRMKCDIRIMLEFSGFARLYAVLQIAFMQ